MKLHNIFFLIPVFLILALYSCKDAKEGNEHMEEALVAEEDEKFRPNFHFTPKEN